MSYLDVHVEDENNPTPEELVHVFNQIKVVVSRRINAHGWITYHAIRLLLEHLSEED